MGDDEENRGGEVEMDFGNGSVNSSASVREFPCGRFNKRMISIKIFIFFPLYYINLIPIIAVQ